MSYSSLYVIDGGFHGKAAHEYENSWLFIPLIWNILSEKYLPKKYGEVQCMIGPNSTEICESINTIMNNSDNTCERVCWELSMQQVFFSKDKSLVADSIREFVHTHKEYAVSKSDGIGTLEREGIRERFLKIADDINGIDPDQYPYFVLKGTSADDSVEWWFRKSDKNGEYRPIGLDEWDELVCEFVQIKDGRITGFIPNTEFFETKKTIGIKNRIKDIRRKNDEYITCSYNYSSSNPGCLLCGQCNAGRPGTG